MTRLKTWFKKRWDWFKKRWDWLKKNWDYTIAPIVVVVAVVVNNWNRGWFNALEGIDIVLIVAILLFFVGYLYILLRIIPTLEFVGGRVGKRNIQVFGTLLGSLVVFYLLWNLHGILPNKWVEISLLAGLVAVTSGLAVYAAAQAYASVKMAREMREQRRPIVVPEVVPFEVETPKIHETDYTRDDIFKVRNVGNGPAIELRMVQLDKEKSHPQIQKKAILSQADAPLEFCPVDLVNQVKTTCYLVCQYRSVLSTEERRIWYETWLPFIPNKSQRGDRIIITPRELKFCEGFEKKDY